MADGTLTWEEEVEANLEATYRCLRKAYRVTVEGADDDEQDPVGDLEEQVLEVEHRSDWQNVSEELVPRAYRLTVTVGGPDIRLVGELDSNGQVRTAHMEYHWGRTSGKYAENFPYIKAIVQHFAEIYRP